MKIFQSITTRISVYTIFVLFVLVLFVNIACASTTDGTIPTNSYAWGENLGWINFGCSSCSVHVTDTLVTGNVWSALYGWINLSPTNGGVTNDSEGHLSGTAWSAGLGWISFSGVVINSTGVFTGIAGVASTTAGRINFNCTNCSVTTDWRPASVRSSGSGGSGSSGGSTSSFGSYGGYSGGTIYGSTTTPPVESSTHPGPLYTTNVPPSDNSNEQGAYASAGQDTTLSSLVKKYLSPFTSRVVYLSDQSTNTPTLITATSSSTARHLSIAYETSMRAIGSTVNLMIEHIWITLILVILVSIGSSFAFIFRWRL